MIYIIKNIHFLSIEMPFLEYYNDSVYFCRSNKMIEFETNKKEGKNATSSRVESLVEHKFVVSFDHMKMKIDKAIDCNIKYSYSIFGAKEFISPEFSIAPGNNEFQEIDLVYWEHIIKAEKMNEAEVFR